MGTISDKLMRIINTKEDIRQALISKGYDVPTSIPFKEYAKMISDLPCRVDSFPDIEGIVARYSALGLTNEQMAENPVWKDLTYNGHDLQMRNLAWKGMSGVGGYVGDFSKWVNNRDTTEIGITKSNSKVIIDVKVSQGSGKNIVFISKSNLGISNNVTIKITSTYPEGVMKFANSASNKYLKLPSNGIITLQDNPEYTSNEMHLHLASADLGQITIEQLPLYPGALVFDGVDDYGVCDNFPILTKEKGYTVVALRQWITRGKGSLGLVSNVKNWLEDGAFVLEYDSSNAANKFVHRPISFGNVNIEMDLPNNFTYQTSKSYKGVPITAGSSKGTNSLFVGKLNNIVGNWSNFASWELVFLDHDATEEELTKIKDYFVKTYPWLFPDQAWTVTGKTNEDEDRATIANITGNGNDLVLSNFAFSGNSGYGLYVCNFNDTSTWTYYSYNGTIEITSSTIHVTEAKTARPFFEKNSSSGGYNKVKIKVTGIKDGEILKFMSDKDIDNTINIEKDGIYSLPGSDKLYYGFRLSNSTNTYPFNCDITIEQIPEYEGYLVADGVDDTIVSKERFTIQQYFTIVGDWQFIIKEDKNSGVIINGKLYCYNRAKGILVYVNNSSYYNDLADTIKIKALSSDGKVYDENWDDIQVKTGDVVNTNELIQIAGHSQQSKYTRVAFKNIAIYNSLLSKDDCIKAYNYLQTLKSK